MSANLQSRYLAAKSVVDPSKVVSFLHEKWPDAAIVYATHDADPVVHTHYVIRFSAVTRWDSFRKWIMLLDPHSYSDSARSWTRSVRYLIHLDNPEKFQYARSKVQSLGIDSDELDQLLQSKGASFEEIFKSLSASRRMSTGSQFLHLVRQGFRPSEVSQVIRCLLDIDHFHGALCRVEGAENSSQNGPEVTRRIDTACESDLFGLVSGVDPFGLPDADDLPNPAPCFQGFTSREKIADLSAIFHFFTL